MISKISKLARADTQLSMAEISQTYEVIVEEEIPQEEPILTEDDLAELEETEATLSELEIFEDSDVFNVLLLGTDERVSYFSENARADSIMLLSLNRRDDTSIFS